MSAGPARHLALVELDEQGEVIGRVESHALQRLEAELEKAQTNFKLAEKDLAGKRRVIADLTRDKVRERLDHPDRDFIVRVCNYWWRRCRQKDHDGPRRINPLSPERFDAVAGLAEMTMIGKINGKRAKVWRYPAEMFKAAIDGAQYDPFTPRTKNGKPQPQNDLEQICRSMKSFEPFIEKAPYVVGTFSGGDLEVPLVPGFTRLSPLELARAREERNNPREGSSSLPSLGGTRMEVGNASNGGAVGGVDGLNAVRPETVGLYGLRLRVVVGVAAPST